MTDLDDPGNADVEDGVGTELVLGERSFRPLYLISEWNEPATMTRRISVAILLPSGVGSGDFTLRVVDGGEFLELTVCWPPTLIDLEIMHKKWLRPDAPGGFQTYHPKLIGFESALKAMRSHSSEIIESTARIRLPFPVQTHIDGKFNLAWRDNSSKMVYVDLKAFVEDYAILKDAEEFEVL